MKSSLLIALLAGLFTATAWADDVLLTNGRTIRGTVVDESDTEVVLRLPDGNQLRFARKRVKEVRRSPAPPPPPPIDDSRPAPVKLRWGMQPGKEVTYRTRYRHESAVPDSGQPSSFQEWSNHMTLRCTGTRVDELELVLTVNRAQHAYRNEGGEGGTDSQDPDPAKRGETDLIGLPITFRLSRRGVLLELLSIGPTRFSDIQDVEARRGMEQTIGDHLLRSHLLGLVGTLPEGSVSPGKESWEELYVITAKDPGNMTLTVINSLGASSAREFTVNQTGGLKLHGMNARMLKSSETKGTVTFSRTGGYLSKIRQRTVSRMEYEINGQQVPADVVISLDLDTE